MKKLAKIILTIMLIFNIPNFACANSIGRTISQSGINKGAVSVSVKDVHTGKTVYSLNDKQPKSPASTLKIITYNASMDTLGNDYEFSTELYKSTNNDLYLKLSGDPYFTYRNLRGLFETAKSKNITEPKNIYIDDYIFDDVEWGEGWQWDDDLNPLMPKFSSYNIDRNLLEIIIFPQTEGSAPEIRTSVFYPVTFMNLATTGSNTNIKLARNNSISPDIINVSGTVSRKTVKKIPVNNPKRYFVLRCEDAVRRNKINYYGKYTQKKMPGSGIYLVDKISHPISDLTDDILKNSSNFTAETLFKAAGAKFVNNTGSLGNSQKMLNAYFEKIGLNSDSVKITDGSGVSKNNLVTADFMTEFLIKVYNNEDFKTALPTSGEGTLANRMLYFKDNLRAKTGTLSDISAIAGYITSRSGKTYAFDIMINSPKAKEQDMKSLEEYILRDIYTEF